MNADTAGTRMKMETSLETPINADERRLALDRVTEKIIACAYKVSNALGCGFLEKVYENALAIEIRKAGLHAEQQKNLKVYYDGAVVGDYIADLFVEESVLVELKVATGLDPNHFAQCMNYLRATGLSICLLLNFGKPKVQIRRVVCGF